MKIETLSDRRKKINGGEKLILVAGNIACGKTMSSTSLIIAKETLTG